MKPGLSVGDEAKLGHDMRELYSVNQLALELGVTPRTIRFYETKGLVAPERAGNARVFTRRDRARLLLVLRGKRLGFSLDEIREYLDLYAVDRGQASQLRVLLEHAQRRIQNLESQRRDLEQTLSELYDIERQAQAALASHAIPAKAG